MDDLEDIDLDLFNDDILCQRAMAMCKVAQVVDQVQNKESKAELLSLMKKINLSLALPSTAELHVIQGGKSGVQAVRE